MPGTPNALPRTTKAVLRPTPGSVTRSSSRPGTSPPKSSRSAAESPMSDFALARKKPVGRMISSSSSGTAAAMSSGGGVLREQRGRRLVHPQVGRLGGQDRGDEQLEGVAEVQLRVGVRIDLGELAVDPAGATDHRQPRLGLSAPLDLFALLCGFRSTDVRDCSPTAESLLSATLPAPLACALTGELDTRPA